MFENHGIPLLEKPSSLPKEGLEGHAVVLQNESSTDSALLGRAREEQRQCEKTQGKAAAAGYTLDPNQLHFPSVR